MKYAGLTLICAGLIACTPVTYERGYLADPALEATVQKGVDTKSTIQERFGNPTTQATFDDETWYYISSHERQVAFFSPTVQSRDILAIAFDKDGKVDGLNHYTLEDGHVVAFEARETPARGRELTFLQNLFSATPGAPTGQNPIGDPNPGGGNTP